MIINCAKCATIIYVEPLGKKTRRLCSACLAKDKLDKATKLNAGFGPVQ